MQTSNVITLAPRPRHQHFEIAANGRTVTVRAPAQRVATRPFQPVAEHRELPGVLLSFEWSALRSAFRAFVAGVYNPHPAAPWLERIAAHVRDLEPIVVVVRPWREVFAGWLVVRPRSAWTGLSRLDLLAATQISGCDEDRAVDRAVGLMVALRRAGRRAMVKRATTAPRPD